MILTNKNSIRGCSDEYQDIVFKNTKTSDFSNIMVETVPLDNSCGKKRIFEKIMCCLEEGYLFSISSCIREMPSMN